MLDAIEYDNDDYNMGDETCGPFSQFAEVQCGEVGNYNDFDLMDKYTDDKRTVSFHISMKLVARLLSHRCMIDKLVVEAYFSMLDLCAHNEFNEYFEEESNGKRTHNRPAVAVASYTSFLPVWNLCGGIQTSDNDEVEFSKKHSTMGMSYFENGATLYIPLMRDGAFHQPYYVLVKINLKTYKVKLYDTTKNTRNTGVDVIEKVMGFIKMVFTEEKNMVSRASAAIKRFLTDGKRGENRYEVRR